MKDLMKIITINVLLTLNLAKEKITQVFNKLHTVVYRCMKITVPAYIMKIKYIALLLRIIKQW